MTSTEHQMPASWAHGISFFAGVLLIVGGGSKPLRRLRPS